MPGLNALHQRKGAQRLIGLLLGFAFGFLLHKGGVTRYDRLIGQLLLKDFTVVKVMLTAVIVGMVGVYLLRDAGLARLHPKSGSLGATAVGGLIFGVGFGLLGYCPGTLVGALGEGWLDALVGGAGILIGAGLFAARYPRLREGILKRGDFGALTLPEWLKVNAWVVIVPMALLLAALLYGLERAGL
ncbi:MAG: putative inner membrane protein [Lentisphaerae bacterium ADurb.BinA184]|nr:MAG: putative inner membrane protein [Lentisphaerae bacterium ADurb.BinA184]